MVRIFTHNDMDGYGCSLVAKYYIGDQLDESYCDYGNSSNSLDSKISDFIQGGHHKKYDLVLITDISPSDFVAEMINQNNGDSNQKFLMIDHHESAKHLSNRYLWAQVETHVPLEKIYGTNHHMSCATWLLLEFFKSPRGKATLTKLGITPKEDNAFLDFVVEKIRRYDTWEWKTFYGDEKAADLNMLFYLYGGPKFKNEFLVRSVSCGLGLSTVHGPSDDGLFNSNELFFLDCDKRKTKDVISSIVATKTYKMNFFGYNSVIAFSDTHASELGNTLCERNPDVDIAVVISLSNKNISFRTIKSDINLSELISAFGGGGHRQAAGCHFGNDVIVEVIRTITEDLLWKKSNMKFDLVID